MKEETAETVLTGNVREVNVKKRFGKRKSRIELYGGGVILFSIRAVCIYGVNESAGFTISVKRTRNKADGEDQSAKLDTSQHQLSV